MREGVDFNAPFDPFEATYSPERVVTDFSILKASWILQGLGPMPRHEDMRKHHPDAYFSADKLPRAVIFVSHRWDSPEQPDAAGEQANAIRYFLKAILDVSLGLAVERRPSLTSGLDLLRQGYFQAAYFYRQGVSFVAKAEDEGWTAIHPEAAEPDRILESIGVFYDYSSLPQDKISERLVQALRHLHDLIGISTMLILRRPEDSYEERAWCALEVSVSPDLDRTHCLEKIVLRIDKLGHSIDPTEISLSTESSMEHGGKLCQNIFEIALLYDTQISLLEDDRLDRLFTPRRTPDLFKGQLDLIRTVFFLLHRAAENFRRDSATRICMKRLVANALKIADLKTSNPADVMFVGNLILYYRLRGDAPLARLFADSLRRFLDGRSTVLKQFSMEDSSFISSEGISVIGTLPSKVIYSFED